MKRNLLGCSTGSVAGSAPARIHHNLTGRSPGLEERVRPEAHQPTLSGFLHPIEKHWQSVIGGKLNDLSAGHPTGTRTRK